MRFTLAKKRLPFLLLLSVLILFSACGNSSKKWENKLIEIIQDKKVTTSEYEDFKITFSREKAYSNEKWCKGKGVIDSLEFIRYLKSEKCTILWEEVINPDYHVYIDGSDLTEGYIKKTGMSTTMNGILYEKISKIVEKNKVKLCLMNSECECEKEHEFNKKEQIQEYMEKEFSLELHKTTGQNSLFYKIIPKIAEKVDDKNIVILVSDLITSTHNDNATHSLEMLKGIDIKDKSFYLLGYEVDFNGYFWFSNNQKSIITTKRPFYVVFIANKPSQIINIKNMKFWKQESIGEYISLHTLENDNISIRFLRGKNNLDNIEIGQQNELNIKNKDKSIKFVVDVAGMEYLEDVYSQEYLSDKNNYKLSNDKYEIKEIRVEKEEKKYYFTVQSNSPEPTTLSFDLKINELPKWIKNNSLDITDIEQEKTKTFGLYNLISNLAKNNKDYSKLFSVSIK